MRGESSRFETTTASWWCPGCGNNSVLTALHAALLEIGTQPKDIAFISGIGCSGKISGYLRSYAFHGLHGRTLPVATGIKFANRDLTVIAAGGDGDGYAIGSAHFIHTVRRNPDITYIVMDNGTYGLTHGQPSPTSAREGALPDSVLPPLDGLAIALAAGATFIARASSAHPARLSDLIRKALTHRGFAIVEVLSPCVVYGAERSNEQVYVEERIGYDRENRGAAFNLLTDAQTTPIGVIFQSSRPTFEEVCNLPERPLTTFPLSTQPEMFSSILDEHR